MSTLTEGALEAIMVGEELWTDHPILQILASKKVATIDEGKERLRVLLSDGRSYYSYAMLTAEPNEKLSDFTVIKVKNYFTSRIDAAKDVEGFYEALLIIEKEVLEDGDSVGGKIGSPVKLAL